MDLTDFNGCVCLCDYTYHYINPYKSVGQNETGGRAGSMARGLKHPLFLDFLFLLYQDKRKPQRQRLKRQVS